MILLLCCHFTTDVEEGLTFVVTCAKYSFFIFHSLCLQALKLKWHRWIKNTRRMTDLSEDWRKVCWWAPLRASTGPGQPSSSQCGPPELTIHRVTQPASLATLSAQSCLLQSRQYNNISPAGAQLSCHDQGQVKWVLVSVWGLPWLRDRRSCQSNGASLPSMWQRKPILHLSSTWPMPSPASSTGQCQGWNSLWGLAVYSDNQRFFFSPNFNYKLMLTGYFMDFIRAQSQMSQNAHTHFSELINKTVFTSSCSQTIISVSSDTWHDMMPHCSHITLFYTQANYQPKLWPLFLQMYPATLSCS